MENLPIYIAAVFTLTTLLTVWFMCKASHGSKSFIIVLLLWAIVQGGISLTGFYTVTSVTPPRFGLLLFPPVIFIIMQFFLKKGKAFMDGLDVKTLTLLHIVRIPVELILYWLFLHKSVPQLMTFEGRNFDIFCGLTAPIIYYFGYVKGSLNRGLIIAWNILCLLLLFNIAVMAVFSAPFPFQKFGFDQPNIALFYFPFIWLPCLVVPAVLYAHLVSLRKLLKNQSTKFEIQLNHRNHE